MRARKIRESTGEVKAGRLDEACARYGLGQNTLRDLAREAGAVVRVGRVLLFNFTFLDDYIDRISGTEGR